MQEFSPPLHMTQESKVTNDLNLYVERLQTNKDRLKEAGRYEQPITHLRNTSSLINNKDNTEYDSPINMGLFTKNTDNHSTYVGGQKVNQSMILVKKSVQIDELDGAPADSNRDNFGDT